MHPFDVCPRRPLTDHAGSGPGLRAKRLARSVPIGTRATVESQVIAAGQERAVSRTSPGDRICYDHHRRTAVHGTRTIDKLGTGSEFRSG